MIGVSMLMIPKSFLPVLFHSGLSDSVASGSAIATGAKPVTDGYGEDFPEKRWAGCGHGAVSCLSREQKSFTQRRFDNARERREEYRQKRAQDANAVLDAASATQTPGH